MDLYYSEEYRDELIELSDKHILWHIKFSNDKKLEDYNANIDALSQEFQRLYNTDLLLVGRSGRHVCVRNTPANRKNMCRMKRTVCRMQNQLLQQFK